MLCITDWHNIVHWSILVIAALSFFRISSNTKIIPIRNDFIEIERGIIIENPIGLQFCFILQNVIMIV